MNKRLVYTIALACIATAASGFFFCFYHNLITITLRAPGFNKRALVSSPPVGKKRITLWYWHKQELKHEEKELLWASRITENAASVIRSWLTLLDEEEILLKSVTLQSIATDAYDQELFISLDRSPFDPESSTYDAYMLMESLLKSLRSADIALQSVRMLVDHAPLQDNHLDFSQPWPCQGFLVKLHSANQCKPVQPLLTIMIDAAGDAQRVGRTIHDSFERGVALQVAEKLVEELKQVLPGCRILLASSPGDASDTLQRAAFANRLGVDLFFSIHCYQQKGIELPVDFYYFSFNPVQDDWYKSDNALSLKPYNQTYLPCFKENRALAHHCAQAAAQIIGKAGFTVLHTCGIPFKPLIGLDVPAIACEIGVHTKQELKNLPAALSQVIQGLV